MSGGSAGTGSVFATATSWLYVRTRLVCLSTTVPLVATQRPTGMPQVCAAAAMSISRAWAPAMRIGWSMERIALDPAVK